MMMMMMIMAMMAMTMKLVLRTLMSFSKFRGGTTQSVLSQVVQKRRSRTLRRHDMYVH
jgi:hypothetical protein